MKRHGGNKGILVNERSQSEKAIYCMIPQLTTGHSGKGETVETIKSSDNKKMWRGGVINRWSTEDFQGNETTLMIL